MKRDRVGWQTTLDKCTYLAPSRFIPLGSIPDPLSRTEISTAFSSSLDVLAVTEIATRVAPA